MKLYPNPCRFNDGEPEPCRRELARDRTLSHMVLERLFPWRACFKYHYHELKGSALVRKAATSHMLVTCENVKYLSFS